MPTFSISKPVDPQYAAIFLRYNFPITTSLRIYQKKHKKKLVRNKKEGVYLQPLRATPQGVVRSEVHWLVRIAREKAYFLSRFFYPKKLQISLPEIKKGLYVCSRLEKSQKGFDAKKKVHWLIVVFEVGKVLIFSRFEIKKRSKKLQINLPEQNKELYVCSRLENSLRGFDTKEKVHWSAVVLRSRWFVF